jgi:putative membrane protein
MEMSMIERRVALAVVAAAVASPAFSQGSRAGRGTQSSAERQYLQQTMAVGSLSLALSRVAEQKARFQKLNEFAGFEVAEQETVADVLTALQNPGVANGNIKAPSESQVEQHLNENGRSMVQKLRSAQAGREFDEAYRDAEVDGHEQLLHIQEQYLGTGRNVDFLNVAKLVRGMAKEHLQLLADIKMEMAAEATTGAAPGRR